MVVDFFCVQEHVKSHSGEIYVMSHSETLWYVEFQSKRKGCVNISKG